MTTPHSESRARRHDCMGADCAVCYPNEIAGQLRDLAAALNHELEPERP